MNAHLLFLPSRTHRPLPLWVREEVSTYGAEAGPAPPADPETVSDWALAHARIAQLGRERAAHEREVCRWLACADRLGVHARAGYASLREYADRMLGLRGRQTEERLRVGRVLAKLPALDDALAAGSLSWSAVRELTRVATAETELAWIDWAKGRTARAIERAVASRLPGDGPRAAGDPSRVPHRLSFSVRAETVALFRDLQARVRSDLGGDVDDDTLLFEIARRALCSGSGGGPEDEGRASYQVAVSRCDACGLTTIDAGGESEVVDPAIAEMVDCDHQHLGCVDGAQAAASADVKVAESTTASAPSPHRGAGGAKSRATQSIPPAVRRQVLRRDRKRCIVPGCANHRYLDVHHLDPRSEGGGHDPERLGSLCGAHHRAVHRGRLWIDGRGSSGFLVRHAGGEGYGAPPTPRVIEAASAAQSALEHLGFKATEARALLEAALRAGAPHDTTTLVREALRLS